MKQPDVATIVTMSGHWRRFRSRRTPLYGGVAVETSLELFLRLETRLQRVGISKRAWRKYRDFTELNTHIDRACAIAVAMDRMYAPPLQRAEAWLYALALQAPRAAIAQEEMMSHPHGYHRKEARLYELIDFNDAFDAAVIALPRHFLPRSAERIQDICAYMCHKVGTRSFSDEQFGAIVHGLSREIAVYFGLEDEGYHVTMTSRRDDAFGIDMEILDPKTMKHIAVDVKTRSAYYYRIHELHREGRLSDEALIMAERNGFTAVINGRRGEGRRVVTWRIDHEVLGDVVDFRFTETRRLGEQVHMIFLRYGELPHVY